MRTVGTYGGGLYIRGTATLTNTNVYANQGGGILIAGSADLTDCNIHDNVANDVSCLLKSKPQRRLHGPVPR